MDTGRGDTMATQPRITLDDVMDVDFGEPVQYVRRLSDDAESEYAHCLETYAAAQAEAEASQQDLFAG